MVTQGQRGLSFWGGIFLGIFVIAVLVSIIPNLIRPEGSGQFSACQSNLKKIGIACEMYATDWSGYYPESLSQITPNYLKTVPNCPSASFDTYSSSYKVKRSNRADTVSGKTDPFPETFEVQCQGDSHKGLVPSDYPRFHSINGLIYGK